MWQEIKSDKNCLAASIMGAKYRIYRGRTNEFSIYKYMGREWVYLSSHHSMQLARSHAEKNAWR